MWFQQHTDWFIISVNIRAEPLLEIFQYDIFCWIRRFRNQWTILLYNTEHMVVLFIIFLAFSFCGLYFLYFFCNSIVFCFVSNVLSNVWRLHFIFWTVIHGMIWISEASLLRCVFFHLYSRWRLITICKNRNGH